MLKVRDDGRRCTALCPVCPNAPCSRVSQCTLQPCRTGQVHADGSHERVSGSSLGGGTFWGLARLLTGAQSFDEVLALCAQGDNGTVHVACGCCSGAC